MKTLSIKLHLLIILVLSTDPVLLFFGILFIEIIYFFWLKCFSVRFWEDLFLSRVGSQAKPRPESGLRVTAGSEYILSRASCGCDLHSDMHAVHTSNR